MPQQSFQILLGGTLAGAAVVAWLQRRNRKSALDARIDEVLDFWFCPDSDDASRTLWHARGSARDAADAAVRDKFAGVAAEALRGALGAWEATPRGAIALVVALDQRGGGAGNRDPLEEPASPFERTPLSRERCKKRSKAA